MNFPIQDYTMIVTECRAIVEQRDSVGRNDVQPFHQQFPHGFQDISFELHRRVGRVLGAEKRGELEIARNDALDLANYAIFYIMLLDKARHSSSK